MASISTSCFDVVANTDTDSPDVPGHGDTDSPDMPGHGGRDSPDVPGHWDTDSPDMAGHGGRDSTYVVVLPSTDVIVHPNTDPKHVFHENTGMVDYEKISSTIAVDHSYTESANVVRHAHRVSTDGRHAHTVPTGIIHEGTDAEDVCHENPEADVDESTSQTEAVEHSHTYSADVVGLDSISSTDIVDCGYTDTLDVADNVIAYSTNEVHSEDTYSTNVAANASTESTDAANHVNTESTDAANHASTDSMDDMAVHASSPMVDSAVKKAHISKGSSLHGNQRILTPVTTKEVGASVPDITPSRRSSRKKQSTFSSDFEYYALGNMKIEMKSEPMFSYKPRQMASEAHDDDDDEESENDDDRDNDKLKKSATKKMAEKKHKGKTSEAGDSEEDAAEEQAQSEKGKSKVAVKKKAAKFSTIAKSTKKRKIKMEEEESEVDEDSDDDRDENQVAPKLLKGHKRKKDGGVMKVESKKMKVEADHEDESSDEEDSTPISLLKAKLKEESTPISQLKDKLKEESIPISKLKAELKEESIPISQLKAKLKDSSQASHPASQPKTHFMKASHPASQPKVTSVEDSEAFSQLQAQIRQKREMEKKSTTSSSQVRSLMERLADGSLDLRVDYEKSLIHSQKRKLMSSNDTEEVPSKIPKSIQIDKLAPALANLVKRLPPPGHGQVKLKSPADMVSPEAVVANNTGFTKTHTSFPGKSAAGSSHKHQVKTEGGNKPVSVTKKILLDKTGVSKRDMLKEDSPKHLKTGVSKRDMLKEDSPKHLKTGVSKRDMLKEDSPKHLKTGVSKRDMLKEDSPKHVKERKPHGDDVKLVPKKEVRYVTKIKVIRKPDGTIIKKRVLVPEGEMKKVKESKLQVKSSPEKREGKKPTKIENMKASDSQQKSSVTTGDMSSMRHNGKLDSDHLKKKKRHELSSKDDTELKHKHRLKAKVEHDTKHDRPSLTVDDLLKRGVFHKKKHHQPFGNKNLPKPAAKDLKSDTVKDSTKTDQLDKDSAKTDQLDKESRVHKIGDKLDMKKWKGKKSSDVRKHSRDRRRSSDSSKRKKSTETDRKKLEKPSDSDGGKDDGPPVLIPASSVSKPKHKPHKVELEVPLDVTMNDLFKPDTHSQDQLNKDEVDNKDEMSQCSSETHDVHSCVKPEHMYNIMIDHQYSKPASPVTPGHEGLTVDSASTGRDDDIESISHAQTVIMDMNLPDQFLEESNEAVVNDTDNFQDTWPDTMDELQHLVDRRDAADRPSILESLGSELKESGTEFLIVGQVEVGRASALLREERQSTQMQGVANSDNRAELEKARDGSTEVGKASVDMRKQSLGKSRDSTDKKTSLADGERRLSTKDKKSSSEDRKSSLYDRKSSSDKKDIASDKKSGSDSKKKYNSEDKKRYSLDDRRKSSSDDKKKTSSDYKRSSTSEKKVSHEDRRKIADARSDNVEDRKHKDDKSASAELKQQDVDEMDDDSGEEHKFQDDENDIDWEPNDTDTLYCICRKPHNNRFMICCDKCEEWFHGSCVGVSRARGNEMEENEEEYMCPFCSKGDHDSSMEKSAQSSSSPGQVKSKLLQKCVGRKCSKAPRSGSVYCSNECVMSHAQEALKAIREEHVKKKTSEKQLSTHNSSKSASSPTTKAPPPPPQPSSTADTVEVIERETGQLLTGSSAPTQKGLHRWLEQHPTFEVVLPDKHRSKSSSSKDKHSRSDKEKTYSSDKDRHKSDKERKRVETDKRDHTSSKDSSKQSEAEKQQDVTSQTSDGSRIDDRRGDGQKQIRVNVQTALGECLAARAREADDIMLSSNEIKSLAVTIEEELFSMFSDTGHKYRTKYRSLVFNIKDQKNKGLFRKILTGKIKPRKLVQMSTEELASRELAKWREQASKHQLEMIQKTEQQALKESEGAKHMRKKTHKGEVEVEEEDLSILETRLEEKKEPEPEPQEEQPQVPVIDTTSEHRAHLFDLNCKVCTGKVVPGREEKTAPEKPATVTFEQPEEKTEVATKEDKDDYEKAEQIVKEALRTMQKMVKSVSSLPKMVSSPAPQAATPPLSPKLTSSRRESSSSSASSMSSSSTRRKVVVRSPDSALQSGLEAKSKLTPSGPMLWKGFMSMLDVAKFFTSAYRVSGPTDHIVIPDTISILGRISPEHMWDYLTKIRQAGSKDLTVVRFIPGNDDEKVAYIHLYSYLNSRGRCGVAANSNKQIKDFYIIPLASHSKIPRTLLPFDGPGLEESRPHMLIGVLVRQRGKQATDTSDPGSVFKSGTQSSTASSVKSESQSINSSSGKPSIHRTPASSSTNRVAPVVSRDPRLAKLAAREANPKVSPAQSSIYVSSSTSGEAKAAPVEEYEPEYVPMPVNAKHAYKPVAEYIPTPTVKKKHVEKDTFVDKKERTPRASDLLDRNSRARKEKYHHHQAKRIEKKEEIEDDSDPYSPGKEAEPYSPGQEAAADEPYDPADVSLVNDSDVPVISSMTVSSSTASGSGQPATAAAENPLASVALNSSAVAEPPVAGVTAAVPTETKVATRELVEKMALSNDPQEISAFMVTALSATSSAMEQQKMLVELTSKVEERKLELAGAARSGVEDGDSRKVEGDKLNEGGVSSSCVGAGGASQIPSGFQAASGGPDTATNVHGSLVVEGALEQTVSSLLLLPSSLPASISTSVTAPQVDTSQTEPNPHSEMSLTTHFQDGDKSLGSINTQTVRDSSVDIPDALKALINDVMGNTHVSSLEMRRRMVLKKEVQKVDMSAKEVVKEDRDISEGQLLDKQAEAQKRLMDEAEAWKILETVKKLEQASSGAKLEQQAGSTLDDGGAATTVGGHEFVPELVDTKKDTPSIAPSVDELLEKLKRGGFQFPAQKADTGGASSSCVASTLVQPVVATRSDSPSSALSGHPELPATTSAIQPSLVPPSVSSSAAGSSSLSSVSALHLDLRQTNDLPGSSAPVAAAVTSSSGSVDSKATDYRNYNARVPSTFQNQDDAILYQDRDDRLYRSSAPPVPKHPLDPYAFPPLPGKSRSYLPPARSNLPLQLGPLHPRFPLPSTDPLAAYHPASPADVCSTARAQPPPPGPQSETAPAVVGLVDDLPASDVDLRSRSRAPGSQDRLSPPVQPPPPLPPLPENCRRHNSNQVPGDVDLRSEGSYRPPHAHHTGHHGRGSDRPYQRR